MTVLAVLDTNVVLDLFVFDDPRAAALRDAMACGRVRWVATAAMRAECERVLGYPQVQRQLAARARTASDVLRCFDEAAVLRQDPAAAPVPCADRDDQMFVDLAVAHGAMLLSRDRELLRLRARLAARGIAVLPSWPRADPEQAPAAAA